MYINDQGANSGQVHALGELANEKTEWTQDRNQNKNKKNNTDEMNSK